METQQAIWQKEDDLRDKVTIGFAEIVEEIISLEERIEELEDEIREKYEKIEELEVRIEELEAEVSP